MATERDLHVARLCRERGLATPQQIDECLRESGAGGETLRPLEAVLRSRGYISEAAYWELAQERRPPASAPALDPEVEEALRDPKKRFGKYLLLRQVGTGGMGVVYRAWQTDLRRHVALKFIRGMEADQDLERFAREVQISASLSHPNIASIYDAGEHDGKPFFAMQFVEGETFDRLLAPGRLPVRRAVEILAMAAQAVDYAHRSGVIHRDLKPQNVMVNASGHPFVMDFGLAKSVRTGSSLTGSGLAVGTPSYMAPEQARGEVPRIGPRSDVYSLGAILYQIGAGRPPFSGSDVVTVLVDVVHKDPEPPRRFNPKFHADLETIALKALDKDPDRRYASAGDFAADLRRWLEGEPILARPSGTVSRLIRRLKKHRALTGSAGAILIGLAVALGTLLARQRERTARADAIPHYEEAAAAFAEAEKIRLMAAADPADYPKALARAERRAREAIARDPTYADAHFLLAQTLRRLNRGGEAFESLARVIELERGRIRAYLERALYWIERFASWQRVNAVAARTDRRGPVFHGSAPDPHAELHRAAAIRDLELAGRLNPREYEKALVQGLGEFVQCGLDQLERLPAAEAHFRRAAELSPSEAVPQFLLAHCAMLARDLRAAAGHMDRVLALVPHDAHYLYFATMAYLHAGRLEDAERQIRRAIRLNPLHVDLHNALGCVLTHAGRHEEAAEALQGAIDLHPDDPDATPRANLAYLHYQAGRFAEAEKRYAEAIAQSPDEPDYYEARGAARAAQDRLEEAEEDMDRVVGLRPDAGAHSNRGAIRARRGRHAEALEDYRKALKLDPREHGAHFNLGILHARQGKHEEAAAAYRRSIESGRDSADVWMGLAKAFLKLGRWEEAEEACGKWFERDPRSAAALHDRALAREHRGNVDGALEDLQAALRLKPDDPNALRDLGVISAKMGRRADAVQALERAVELGKTDVEPLLAEMLAGLGRAEEAEAVFTRAVERDRADKMAFFGRARLRHGLGKAREALADIESALAIDPRFAAARGFRGVLLLEANRRQEAAGELRKAIELDPSLQRAFQPFLSRALEE